MAVAVVTDRCARGGEGLHVHVSHPRHVSGARGAALRAQIARLEVRALGSVEDRAPFSVRARVDTDAAALALARCYSRGATTTTAPTTATTTAAPTTSTATTAPTTATTTTG